MLSHWHYDTFKVQWSKPEMPFGAISFKYNSQNRINAVILEEEMGEKPITFKPVNSKD